MQALFREVDVYIAYGRFDDAAVRLKRAMEESPNNMNSAPSWVRFISKRVTLKRLPSLPVVSICASKKMATKACGVVSHCSASASLPRSACFSKPLRHPLLCPNQTTTGWMNWPGAERVESSAHTPNAEISTGTKRWAVARESHRGRPSRYETGIRTAKFPGPDPESRGAPADARTARLTTPARWSRFAYLRGGRRRPR